MQPTENISRAVGLYSLLPVPSTLHFASNLREVGFLYLAKSRITYYLLNCPCGFTMILSSTKYMIRIRLAILFLDIIGVALAGLNSAIARFAVILRDRAKYDLITTNAISDNTFRMLMNNVFEHVVLAALVSALCAIFGAVLALNPRWIREHDKVWVYYGCVQFILGLIILSIGGYLADHVHGFQTSFKRFDGNDNVPYYNIMYYGGVGQAAYGFLVLFMGVAPFVAGFVFDHYQGNRDGPIEAPAS